MLFSLTNALSTFQSPMLREFVLVFFDDILVYSKTWKEHLKHVEIISSVLKSNKFVKMEKCQFGQTQTAYLGHIISQHGVAVDQDKVAAMVEWTRPTTVKSLRGFLALTGYYRKFIEGYGKIAAPLLHY